MSALLQILSAFLLACWFAVPSSAQVAFLGACPNVTVVTDFEPGKYLGRWYEAEKYFFIFELGGKCVTAEYSSEDNGVIGVINKQVNSLTGTTSEIVGEATQVSPNEGKLSVKFPSLPINVAAPYWVLGTDYDNYAVVWGCNNFIVSHTVQPLGLGDVCDGGNLLYAWILTRERNPSASVLEKAYAVVDKNNVSRKHFTKTDQSNCPEN